MTPVAFRRHLHAHPELSFEEHSTADFISEQLSALGIEHRAIAGTGILARIVGRRTAPGDRRAVVLRADIDALPIAERTDLACASQREGVMHACGHDIHAAVLYGVLRDLAAEPDFAGTLLGLFQPGEECNPGGASLVLAEHPFDDYEVAAVVGEHVEPQLEVGTLGFRAGKYMAASDELRFTVEGAGGHGALREQLRDPVAAAAALITELVALNAPERVLSIGRVEAAGATNVVPDRVRMEGTLRTFDVAEGDRTRQRIRDLAAAVDARHGTRTAVDISRGYPPVVNDPALVERAAALARTRGLRVEMLPLRTTAEDFGHYTLRYPSLFYRLGVGRAAGRPHTATFSPDEGAIDTGIGFMRSLALQLFES
ncbi:M20 family metallopeptidase [uncultured Alistipes sp.]|uniref:M20 metallopeptidase family protein n=1 Tax=uncultured Alistipes sp. TaxID=538949 RepID=UPI0025E9CF7D|nr:M20 family metallopeptidase [uncultured Alistipes sp.]